MNGLMEGANFGSYIDGLLAVALTIYTYFTFKKLKAKRLFGQEEARYFKTTSLWLLAISVSVFTSYTLQKIFIGPPSEGALLIYQNALIFLGLIVIAYNFPRKKILLRYFKEENIDEELKKNVMAFYSCIIFTYILICRIFEYI